jgi:hypothetical protein
MLGKKLQAKTIVHHSKSSKFAEFFAYKFFRKFFKPILTNLESPENSAFMMPLIGFVGQRF